MPNPVNLSFYYSSDTACAICSGAVDLTAAFRIHDNHSNDHLTCSKACYYRARRRIAAMFDNISDDNLNWGDLVNCDHCGDPLTMTRADNRKRFCSGRCRVAAHRATA